MPTPVRTSSYTSYNPYTPPRPNPEAPAPAVPAPAANSWETYLNEGFDPSKSIWGANGKNAYQANRARDFFKTRGGHELYGMFEKIHKENPWAARAFREAVMGGGRGENDFEAALIHKMFGGNMLAYNQYRNLAHSQGMEGRVGTWDLAKGTWTNGTNSFGDTPYTYKDWNPYTMQKGLQSLPGHEEDGAESWATYGANPQFGQGYNGDAVTPPGQGANGIGIQKPGMIQGTKNPINRGGGTAAPAPIVPTPGPAAGPSAPPITVNPGTSAVNPTGMTGGYRYQGPAGRVNRNGS